MMRRPAVTKRLSFLLLEVLEQVGMSRPLKTQYTKEFRTEKTKLGAIDAIQNRGRTG
jgi:hypothetical protein